MPFAEQPSPGDGRKLARTSLAGLPDGTHLVRALSRDRAGNDAELALGLVKSDGTAPGDQRGGGRDAVGDDADRRAVVHAPTTGPASGWPDGRPRVALVGRGDDADLAVPGESRSGAGAREAPGVRGRSP